ncbi:hypothetical protein [Streptomyces spectabilis]|uniref:Uncharacterized protein n=1 Tax=Streptomyces spectabilis TaxID=68270 RepID=A0A516RJG4_STRST|nr:hypothetical protein [Streptomyces spectabilis]QDQ15765.1 hypothetical protein FH965_38740 [Streptomyces spectabilis]
MGGSGDPGIGKTALLEHASATVTGFTTPACRGTRTAALRAALGRGGECPDRFLIGVARLTGLRATDVTGALVRTAPHTATLAIVRGHWDRATAEATEGLRVAEETGADHAARQCRLSLAWLAALRGDEPAATVLTDRVVQRAVPCGTRDRTAAAYWIRGQTALFAGRDAEALEWLHHLTGPGHDRAPHPRAARRPRHR